MSKQKSIKIEYDKYSGKLIGEKLEFPKYTTQIINLANQNAQGTRPKVVGQMSDLIQMCPDKSFNGWKKWYLERHPEAINNAIKKIKPMISNLKEAISKIDEEMIRKWVEDLVLVKTAEGLIIQEIVLSLIAKKKNITWRLAHPDEESIGIDGYLGEQPVQIKATTYEAKKSTVREEISVDIIYYKKTDKFLYIYTDLL